LFTWTILYTISATNAHPHCLIFQRRLSSEEEIPHHRDIIRTGNINPTSAQGTRFIQDHARKLPTPEEVVAMLDSKLSLTDDQKAQITPIIADRQQQLRAATADDSTRRFKKARKMKSIYEDSDKKINAILTDDQKKEVRGNRAANARTNEERRQQTKNSSDQ